MNTIRCTNEGGFSLVEALVAMLVFSLVALAISSSTLAAARQNRVSESQATATSIAQSVLECLQLQRRVRSGINLNCRNVNLPGYIVNVVETTPTPPGYQWDVQVTWDTLPGGSVTVSSQSR